MDGRKRIDDHLGSEMMIEVEGSRFAFPDCFNFAEIGNLQANITEHVLKARDGRYIRLTVVGDAEVDGAHGVLKGWYVARFLDEESAIKTRESWAVLRDQPDPPRGGPWR